MVSIAILLATYNGEQYVEEQLVSILENREANCCIFLRDDGSTDETPRIISNIAKTYPGQVSFVNNESYINGHLGNFSALAEYALSLDNEYFAFSDQDDVWHSRKLEKMQARMNELECAHGKSTPILIHSDLRVVNEELNEIAQSFVEFQGLPDPAEHDFPKFFYQNVVTGCTTFFNRALLEIATPIPNEAIVHDWWFAQCAKMFGVLEFINEPLIDYRQHGENSIGAKCHKDQSSYFKKYIYQALFRFPRHLSSSIEQAKALGNLVRDRKLTVESEKKAMLTEFANIKQLNAYKRISWASIAVENRSSLVERCYFKFAFFIVKWVKP